MAGCFGNHWVDRNLEQQLNNYLKQDSDIVECDCGFKAVAEDFEYDEERFELVCPKCLKNIKE